MYHQLVWCKAKQGLHIPPLPSCQTVCRSCWYLGNPAARSLWRQKPGPSAYGTFPVTVGSQHRKHSTLLLRSMLSGTFTCIVRHKFWRPLYSYIFIRSCFFPQSSGIIPTGYFYGSCKYITEWRWSLNVHHCVRSVCQDRPCTGHDSFGENYNDSHTQITHRKSSSL